MAGEGRFNPFQDSALLDHLLLKNVNCLSHFHSGSGQWVTLLRNSPPLVVTSDCTVHLKMRDTVVSDAGVIIAQTSRPSDGSGVLKTSLDPNPHQHRKEWHLPSHLRTPSRSGSFHHKRPLDGEEAVETAVKRERLSPSDPLISPLSYRPRNLGETKTEEVESIGERPARISFFPPSKEKEMDDRMRWISDAADPRGLEARYSLVFSCPFVSSTYHYHQRIWRVLRNMGLLRGRESDRLWKDCVVIAVPYLKQTTISPKSSQSKSQSMSTYPGVLVTCQTEPGKCEGKDIIEID